MKYLATKLASALACASLAFGLTACGAMDGANKTTTTSTNDTQQEEPTSTDTDGIDNTVDEDNNAQTTTTNGVTTTDRQTIELGNTSYMLTVPAGFDEVEMSEDDVNDGQVGSYASDDTVLTFDVYQLQKSASNQTLDDYVEAEAADDDATATIAKQQINDVTVASYQSTQELEDKEYEVLTYVFEGDDEFVRIDFWLGGNVTEAEAEDIMSTLAR